MTEQENLYPAFPPDSRPSVSIGLPFHKACRHHVVNSFKANKVYIIVSKTISETSTFSTLREELGDLVAGIRYGIRQHVPWDDVIEIAKGEALPI